jgi:alpha-1,2-mannosyltransferase
VCSFGLYVGAGALLIRRTGMRADWRTCALWLLAFPAFQQVLLFGQMSALALWLLTLGWCAWQARCPFLAGLALGALVYKPPMLALAAGVILADASAPLVLGVIGGIVMVLSAAAATLGPAIYLDYGSALSRMAATPAVFEPKGEQMQSMRSLFVNLLGYNGWATAGYLIAGVAIAAFVFRMARRLPSRDLVFGVGALAGLLLDPHVYVYDLVLLVVPLGLVLSWLISEGDRPHRAVAASAFFLYWLPLVVPSLGVLRIQLTAPAIAWLLWAIVSDARVPATARR